MKSPISLIIILGCSVIMYISPLLMAHPDADHDHHHHAGEAHASLAGHSHEEKKAGPNGGRIILSVEPHFEFFVRDDRKIQITFLDDDNKLLAPVSQEITAVTGDRSSPTSLTFSTQDKVLLSDQALPEGNKLPIIVTIKTTPDSTPKRERFTIDLNLCSSCDLKEYACVCGH